MIDWLKIYKWFERNMASFLWGCFAYAIIINRVDMASLFVLLLIFHRVDEMGVRVTINNNVINIENKDKEEILKKASEK